MVSPDPSTPGGVSDRLRERVAGAPGLSLTASVLGFFMVTLDAVVVNVALPSIRRDLGGGIVGLQWVVDGYTLMFAAFLLSAGAITDRVGARRTFVIGVTVFAVASAACGLAPSMEALIAGRFVQGSAAAAMMPSSMALIGQAYPQPARRARAVAIWAMGGAIASSAGPVLGGLLILGSWRLIFFVNVPAGLLALLLTTQVLPSGRRQPPPFDWLGQATAVLAMGGVTYGAIEAGAAGFGAPTVLVAFVVAAAALATFLLVEVRGRHPMVPLELFRSQNVSIVVAVGFAFVVGYYGLPFVMSLYLQQQRGLSPLETGAVFIPMMAIGAFLIPFSARVAERVGPGRLITCGLGLMVGGLALLAVFVVSAPFWALTLLMVLVGLGGPAVMPPAMAVILNSVRVTQAGVASGVFNTSRQIGGALAIAVFGAFLGQPGGFVPGLRTSLLIAALVALVATAASRLVRAPPHVLEYT
jgi:DHA2 family methylenomycin A resistance protein-like MFS transporter